MHVRFMRKTWPWGKLLQIPWGTLIQNGTRNKCTPEQHQSQHINYSWSKSLELIKMQPKKFSNVA